MLAVSLATASKAYARDAGRWMNGEPTRVLVQLCDLVRPDDEAHAELLRFRVARVVGKAYPRAEIAVVWREQLRGTQVHLVGDDPRAGHPAMVAKLVELILARVARHGIHADAEAS
jgi:hypothetical protein